MAFLITLQTSILLGELFIYIFINSYIYLHNHEMVQTSIISQETYKHRQRSHVFSMSGQMYHFLAEMLYAILANVSFYTRDKNQSYHMFELLLVFKDFAFGLLTFFQVMASSEMRKDILLFFKRG